MIENINKQAQTDHEVIDIIKNRWSPRAFSDQRVERKAIFQLFEAARWAPSSYNEQPWRYIFATKENPKQFERIVACLNEWNQKWAKHAPVLVLGFVKNYSQNDLSKKNKLAKHDLGAASMQLSLQATALGLSVHQMAGILHEKIRETYHIPEGYDPVTAIAIGYIGNPDDLPEKMRETEVKKRSRKPLSEILFENEW